MKFIWSITECFAIILIGYFSGKLGLISNLESKGISKFITNFALPALVFRSLATINFSDVNWSLIAGIFFAKALLFAGVSLVTLVLTRCNDCGKAGLYGIFTTQSNDFAVGYTLFESLYSGSKVNYANYVYLLAPVQLLVINPFGLLMMELQKFWNSNGNEEQSTHRRCLFLQVCKGVLMNPVVVMTVIGIVWNIAFHQSVPEVIDSFLETLSKSFAATALFLLGLNLVGKVDIVHGSDVLYLPIMLSTAKLIILPFVMRIIVEYCFDNRRPDRFEASNFAFLYGTIPTAPTPFVFALQYEMDTTAVSTGMAISTIAAAPLMYVSASMVKMQNASSKYYFEELGKSVSTASVTSLVSVVWILFIFFADKRWKSVTHRCTIPLLLSQVMLAVGGLLWYYIDINNSNNFYHFQYLLTTGGLFSCRIWFTALSVTLALLSWKGLNFTHKMQPKIMVVAFALSTLLMGLIFLFPQYPSPKNLNPAFEFGAFEKWISIILLSLSTTVITVSLIIQHYYRVRNPFAVCLNNRRLHRIDSGIEEFDVNNDEVTAINDGEDHSLRRREVDTGNNTEVCTLLTSAATVPDPELHFEIKEHLILILVANISMFVTLMVSIDNMIVDNKNSGIFVELQYISVILNYGQGLISFLIFGCNFKLFQKLFCCYRKQREKYSLRLPFSGEESPEMK